MTELTGHIMSRGRSTYFQVAILSGMIGLFLLFLLERERREKRKKERGKGGKKEEREGGREKGRRDEDERAKQKRTRIPGTGIGMKLGWSLTTLSTTEPHSHPQMCLFSIILALTLH